MTRALAAEERVTGDLFAPFRLGELKLPHRIVMAPMTRRRAAAGKLPTDIMARHYAQRAGAALIVSESIEIDTTSAPEPPTRPALVTESQVEAWRRVTAAVHAAGGRIFAQISHMGRTSPPSQLPAGDWPVGPSAIAAEGTVYTAQGPQPYVVPRQLTFPEIAGLVERFGAASARAREAGFDGVEIHGANGYLIDQFLRDGSNRREDAYGGSPEARARFVIEVIEAVRAHWPEPRVGLRLSPTNGFQGMSDSDPAGNFGCIVARLNGLGLAYLHVVEQPVQPEGAPEVARRLRRIFRGPLIRAGGYGRATAAAAIAAGEADLVAFGQAFIANPDLPERLRRGLPLAAADRATFYAGGPKGYVDYPALADAARSDDRAGRTA